MTPEILIEGVAGAPAEPRAMRIIEPGDSTGTTVDGRNHAPPKKPWDNDCPANTKKQWFPVVSKAVQDFAHPQ